MKKTPSLHQVLLTNLRNGPYTYRQVADGTGISVRTVEKIAREEIRDPGLAHAEKLLAFFRKANS
jgi:hypothetical protein